MGTFLLCIRPLETCAKHYQPPRRLRTNNVEEFIDSATPLHQFFYEHSNAHVYACMAAILAETSVLGSSRDRVASLWPMAWVRAPGPTLSIDTLILTPKDTVLGQCQKNVEISSAIVLANSRCTGARLRALVRVRDVRRIMQLQRCVLTPSKGGRDAEMEGAKLLINFCRTGGMKLVCYRFLRFTDGLFN